MVLLIIIVLILAGLLTWWVSKYVIQASQYKKGVLGLNRVHGMLKKYCALRSFKTLRDVTLSDRKDTAHADHVIIGFFGIILLQNIQGKGEYFGDDTMDTWTYIDEKGAKQRIASPYKASVQAEEVLRRRLAQDGVYNVQIESYVVLSGDKEKTMYNGRKNTKILTVAGLKKLLGHSRYEKDNDIDVEQLAAYLQK